MSALAPSASRPERCSSASATSRCAQLRVLDQPQRDARVDRAAAGSHHEPLQGGEAHRRVDRAPAVDRAQRRARAEVAAHDPQLRRARLQELRCAPGDPGVREAVKAEAHERPSLAPLGGQGIGGCGAGQRRVKRRVEACDRGHPGRASLTASSAASDFAWCSGARSASSPSRRRTSSSTSTASR